MCAFVLSWGTHHVAKDRLHAHSVDDLLAEIETLAEPQSFYSLNLWDRSPETQARVDKDRADCVARGEKPKTDGMRLREDWVGAQGVQMDLDTEGHRLLKDKERQAINEAFTRGDLPASAGHATHGGLHALCIYEEVVADAACHRQTTVGLTSAFQAAYDDLRKRDGRLPALDLDPKPLALTGLLYAPQATDPKGRRREWRFVRAENVRLFKPLAEPQECGARSRVTSAARVPKRVPERILWGRRNETLTSIAGSLRNRGASEASIQSALQGVNAKQCEPPLEADEVASIARSVGRYPAKPAASLAESSGHPAGELCEPDGAWAGYFAWTDRGNALRLAWRLHGQVRWAGETVGWLRWTGTHWAHGDLVDSEVRELVAKMTGPLAESALRAEAARQGTGNEGVERAIQKFVAGCGRTSWRRNALSDLRDVAAIRTPPDSLDENPYLLTVSNGTVDLRSRVLRRHDPDDLITACVHVPYDPDAVAPRWLQFLDEVADGDDDFVALLQRVAGLILVGEGTLKTKAFFYFFGPPNSGKGTYLSTIQSILGDDLCGGLGWGALAAATSAGPNSEIAQLAGKRMALIADTGSTPRWDAETLKKLTGGDHLTCSEKMKPARSFRPGATLLIAGNERPRIAGTGSQAILDRLRVLPFRRSFSTSEGEVQSGRASPAQSDLKSYLTCKEGPGILRWMVDGAYEYCSDGLGTCDVVEAERSSWARDDRGWLEEFLETCTVTETDPDAPLDIRGSKITAEDLHVALRAWMDSQRATDRDLERVAGAKRDVSRQFNIMCSTNTRYRHVRRDQRGVVITARSAQRGTRCNAWGGIAWRSSVVDLLGSECALRARRKD